MAATFGDTAHATGTVVHVDPAGGWLRVANAGHLAPLLAVPAGPDAAADVSPTGRPGPALGVSPHPEYPVEEIPTPPGAVLCLYTDVLVDRRGSGVGTDVGGLRRVLAQVGRAATAVTAREILDRVLAEMVGGAPVDDDVCLLVLTATRS